jgi:hypothetical protein
MQQGSGAVSADKRIMNSSHSIHRNLVARCCHTIPATHQVVPGTGYRSLSGDFGDIHADTF